MPACLGICRVALVLAFSVGTGHARHVQTSSRAGRLQCIRCAENHKRLKSPGTCGMVHSSPPRSSAANFLATLLLAIDPADAFNLPGQALRRGPYTSVLPVNGRRSCTLLSKLELPEDIQLNAKLAIGDVVLIFAFSFAKTLGDIILSPTFPGWLAPARTDPKRLSATFGFADGWVACWIAACFLTNAFPPPFLQTEDSTTQAITRIGPTAALYTFGLAMALRLVGVLIAPYVFDVMPEALPAPLQINVDNAVAAVLLGAYMVFWRDIASKYWWNF